MMENNQSYNSLKQELSYLNNYVNRIDTTLEKITEVSARLSEILAGQGARLDIQERVSDQLQTVLEQRRLENENNIKDVYIRIEKIEKDLYGELKDMRNEASTQHDEIKGNVHRIEKWMWTSMGGIAVLVFILELVLNQII